MERYLCDTCLYANNCQFIAKHKEGATGCSAYINTYGVSVDRLCEICEAEREGRLVILNTCGACEHFTGAGDWGLCCTKSEKRLCYRSTDAKGCKSYLPRDKASPRTDACIKLRNIADSK